MFLAEKKEMVGKYMETKSNFKGEDGEEWISEAVKLFGWEVIKFDWWQPSADRLFYKEGKALLAQLKYKEPRIYYPDTGLERYRFVKFRNMVNQSGIRGIILFTDSASEIYGNYEDLLKDEIHGGEYNKKDNTTMIYFWLKDLKKLKELL